MNDSLLPSDIKITPGKTLDEKEAVCIDLGRLLELSDGSIRLTVALVLPVRQAEIFASQIIGKVLEIRRHGLRLVSEDDGA